VFRPVHFRRKIEALSGARRDPVSVESGTNKRAPLPCSMMATSANRDSGDVGVADFQVLGFGGQSQQASRLGLPYRALQEKQTSIRREKLSSRCRKLFDSPVELNCNSAGATLHDFICASLCQF